VSDQVLAGVLAALIAVVAGAVGAILSPFAKDRVARRAEERATVRAKLEAAERQEAKLADERRQALRDMSDALTKAMNGANDDRLHGLFSRTEIDAARWRAVGLAPACHDETLRQLVDKWAETFDATPQGWDRQGGATAAQWEVLHAVYQTTLDVLGQVLRAETGTAPGRS
jgi:hypothetical protein